MSNTITLRGNTYPVEWVTDTAFLGMAARLTRDGGVLQANDPKSAAKVGIALGDCDYVKSFTYWVKQTCPSIPDDLVWHTSDNYGMKLTVQEILTLLSQYQEMLETEKPSDSEQLELPPAVDPRALEIATLKARLESLEATV